MIDAQNVRRFGLSEVWRYRLMGWAGTLIKYLMLVFIMLVVLFPIYWMLITAFKTRLELTTYPPTLFPQNFTWGNYREAFGLAEGDVASDIPIYMLNSVKIVSISTFISLVFGTLAGYSLARFPFTPSFKKNISFWIISTRMIPPIVAVIPIYLLFRDLKLLDRPEGLIVVYTGFTLPFTTWMMRAFVREVPVDLEEAAMVDGDTRLTALFRIVLPLTAPGLAATAIFALILVWNEFLFAFQLGITSRAITLPVGIAGFVTQYELLWGQMSAVGTVAIIPIVVFTLLVQRYLVRGLTFGAVK